jgi:hypothetical protein
MAARMAGTQFERPEEDMAEEIGMSHPRWVGTRWGLEGALYGYRRVEVVGDRHRSRYQDPGRSARRLYDGLRT